MFDYIAAGPMAKRGSQEWPMTSGQFAMGQPVLLLYRTTEVIARKLEFAGHAEIGGQTLFGTNSPNFILLIAEAVDGSAVGGLTQIPRFQTPDSP